MSTQFIHGSAYQIIHKRLGFHCLCKMGPKTLTQLHKQQRLDIFQKHSNRYGNKLDIFVNRIDTGDERLRAGK
ncbi:hypothetical protein LAZ67_5004111 [Cordylochernes scorpioides]|uniref:Uncharacterized protein n=1 Tax=Cordylochernes scorpioides TaxID=51811 RepID=A0ABY6KHQ1_9ARAC|nr:hypothetical protein LAZ67_5004111 [Cordylochernes scorpioides]